MQHVIILGAGISGLSLAWFLKKRFGNGLKITLIEEKSRPGGWIHTLDEDGFLFEQGPRSLRSRGTARKTLELIEELSLQDQVITASPSAKKRYLWARGKLRSLPQGFFGFFTSSATRHLLGAFLRERFIPKGEGVSSNNLKNWYFCLPRLASRQRLPPCQISSSYLAIDESIRAFFERRFGNRVVEELIDPMVSGIFAGDIDRLSMQACFPSVYSWEERYSSLVKGAFSEKKTKPLEKLSSFVSKMDRVPIFSFTKGLQTLTDTLASYLAPYLKLSTSIKTLHWMPKGVTVEVEGTQGKEFLVADHFFSTVPASQLAFYLQDVDQELTLLLKEIEAVSIASVHLGYNHPVLKREGFGYLIPKKEGESILGVVFDSSVFPEQNKSSKETRLTVIMGGAHGKEIEELDEKELAKRALEAVSRHLRIYKEPRVLITKKARRAIPQYQVGYLRRMERIEEILLERFPQLTVTGNYFQGVSVNECIAKGFEIAKRWKKCI